MAELRGWDVKGTVLLTPENLSVVRFIGKKKNTSAWYTNVISYVAEKEGFEPSNGF